MMELLFAVGFVAVAWTVQSDNDDSRGLSDDICTVFTTLGLSRKVAARMMGLNDGQLSRELARVDALNLYRLTFPGIDSAAERAAFTQRFWMAFLALRAQRAGAELLTPDQVALIKGAAAMGPRMVAAVFQQERKAS